MEANSIYYDLFLILCLIQGSNLFWRIRMETGPPGHVQVGSVLHPSWGSERNHSQVLSLWNDVEKLQQH